MIKKKKELCYISNVMRNNLFYKINKGASAPPY